MHPIDTPDKTFHDGDGVSELGTILPAWWLNQVQSELLAVLTAAGIQPDKAKPNQVVEALRKLIDEQAGGKGLPVGAVIGFPRAITSQEGFLKADGSTFAQATYPDLHRVLGGNKLPNLTRSDIGMTAYFAFDDIPDGWIKYDDIAAKVTQSAYPELYRKLAAQYGSIAAVPKAEDRFIRNAAGGLTVGTQQGDAIRNITGSIDSGADQNRQLFDDVTASGALAVSKRGWKRWTGDSNDGYNVPTAFDFDASRVVPVAAENRPKALAMVLCIKAQNSLDDVVMWIKAYGKVTNAGVLDASTLAAQLQDKANRNHTHRAADISDLGDAVKQQMAAAMQHQASTNGYTKLPNGLIDQWGEVLMGWRGEGPVKVVFPIAFASECYNVQITAKSSGRSGAVGTDLTIGAGEITATGFRAMLNTWAQGVATNDFQGFLWRAIGK